MTNNSLPIPIPATKTGRSSLADYIELNAIASPDKSISLRDISSQISRPGNEVSNRIVDDGVPKAVTEAFEELQNRRDSVRERKNYSFDLSPKGDLLTYRDDALMSSWLYLFCLFATVPDMQVHKIQVGNPIALDGTELFERVCEHAIRAHAKTSHALVMGTGGPAPGLEASVEHFLAKYRERGKYDNIFNHGTAGDGGCDVIAWHEHPDGRFGKSTFFCSCKTGTSWKDSGKYIPKPSNWSKSYASNRAFSIKPIPCLFVTESLSRKDYEQKVEEESLLGFDRTRIASYADQIPLELSNFCKEWTFRIALSVYGIQRTKF